METRKFKEFLEAIETVFPDTEVGILLSERDIYYLVDIQKGLDFWYELLFGYDPEAHFLYIYPGRWVST